MWLHTFRNYIIIFIKKIKSGCTSTGSVCSSMRNITWYHHFSCWRINITSLGFFLVAFSKIKKPNLWFFDDFQNIKMIPLSWNVLKGNVLFCHPLGATLQESSQIFTFNKYRLIFNCECLWHIQEIIFTPCRKTDIFSIC